MPKVLVSTSIGIPQISLGAAKYLAERVGDTVSPDPYFLPADSNGKALAVFGGSSKLIKAWLVHFNNTKSCYDDAGNPLQGDVPDTASVNLSFDTTGSELRNTLVSYVDALGGDYKMLDKLNDNNTLRIVDIPEGVRYIIAEDPELGVESVQEVPRIWNAYHDEDYRFLVWVKKICSKDASDSKLFPRIKLGNGYGIAFEGNYGMAINYANTPYTTRKILLLKKNTYYRATKEHPQCVFEVVNEHNNPVVNLGPFIDADEFNAYANLYSRLITKEIKADEIF